MAFAASLGAGVKFLLLVLLAVTRIQAATYFVTVAGLGGDPDYEVRFANWSKDLDHQLKLNGSDAHVETLSGPDATRQHLHELLTRLGGRITSDDAFALFLIGHGTFDGSDYKFNVPGPDITAIDLRDWLSQIRATRQLVVNMTSCSGASLAVLAAKHRIIVTATKSGNEKNAPIFPRYFVDAFHDPAADTDKDGTISLEEAYRYTQQKVSAYFVTEKLIASEHSQINDAGNGTFPLLRPPNQEPAAPAALIKRKDELEAKIDRLKYNKSSMAEADYKQQLAALLLDLARTQAEIDK